MDAGEETQVRQRFAALSSDAAEAGSWLEDIVASLAPLDLSVDHVVQVLDNWWSLASGRPAGRIELRIRHLEDAGENGRPDRTCVDIVSDDRPFIVDSLLAALDRLDVTVHLALHPTAPAPAEPDSITHRLDSLVHLELEPIDSAAGRQAIERELVGVMEDVKAAVDDWRQMRSVALDAAHALYAATDRDALDEAAALLRWMEHEAFTFLATSVRLVTSSPTSDELVDEEVLGVHSTVVRDLSALVDTASDSAQFFVTTTGRQSVVHRDAPLDQVTVIVPAPEGGRREFHLVGLFTSVVYSSDVLSVPWARAIARSILDQHTPDAGHERSRLLHALREHPREELLRADAAALAPVLLDVSEHRDRTATSLHVRQDAVNGEVSCLVLIPRDRFDTSVRRRVLRQLSERFAATSTRFQINIGAQHHARLHVVLTPGPDVHVDHELSDLAASLDDAVSTWDDRLADALDELDADHRLPPSARVLLGAVPDSYRDAVLPERAIDDLRLLCDVLDTQRPRAALVAGVPATARCLVVSADGPLTLSDLLPTFHHLGATVLDERPHLFALDDGRALRVYELNLTFAAGATSLPHDAMAEVLTDVWSGRSEADSLSSLVVSAGLDSAGIALVRAVCRCQAQFDRVTSAEAIINLVAQEPAMAVLLHDMLVARLDPAAHDDTRAETLRTELLDLASSSPSLETDRTFTSLCDLAHAVVRTSHWVDRGGATIALKINTGAVGHAPAPVPHAEIFVTGPDVEGVHLRFGAIARGGLRWSDRPNDVRTEVLGLVKAQAVKNAVIVPVGAKGGFVVRRPVASSDRAVVGAQVRETYEAFIAALLDVTDDLHDGLIVAPTGVRRLDGDDPYLVVAADKGTASFSDVANDIAAGRGFWLGDAFASGGSAGYDHKALAITARGAWVSVAHHFARMNRDVDRVAVRTVGIGDMSGDVFGNGMLSTDTIELVAAFDHRHVFIDPTPDAAASYVERQRLYDLPGSTWADYDEQVLSPGAMIVPRTAKSVDLSREARMALGIDHDESMSPDELIRCVLRAPVDLLWNGGIGTYVKAAEETHLEVGDRATDAVRIDATELRCAVIGEGGNLGLTQAARVEAARLGVRLNTDAIDNSGGVDCSDREVNLKVLLGLLEDAGELDRTGRNTLLESDAEAVCSLVLATNLAQNSVLTLAERSASTMTEVHERLMVSLERRSGLDRALEFLPDTAALAERSAGLTRPELAVLLAYVKNRMAIDVTEPAPSGRRLIDDAAVERLLMADLPPNARERAGDRLDAHPLHDALAAKVTVNTVVNRGGSTMVHRLIEETSASPHEVLKAHLAAWAIFDLDERSNELDQLDGIADADAQEQLRAEIKRLAERATRWLLRHEAAPIDVDESVERYVHSIRQLSSSLRSAHAAQRSAEAFQLGDDDHAGGTDDDRAEYERAFGYLDLADVALRTGALVDDVASTAAALSGELRLPALRAHVIDLPRPDHWATLARGALRDEVSRAHAAITADVLGRRADDAGRPITDRVTAWLDVRDVELTRHQATMDDIDAAGRWDLAGTSVAVRSLTALSRPTAGRPNTGRATDAS